MSDFLNEFTNWETFQAAAANYARKEQPIVTRKLGHLPVALEVKPVYDWAAATADSGLVGTVGEQQYGA